MRGSKVSWTGLRFLPAAFRFLVFSLVYLLLPKGCSRELVLFQEHDVVLGTWCWCSSKLQKNHTLNFWRNNPYPHTQRRVHGRVGWQSIFLLPPLLGGCSSELQKNHMAQFLKEHPPPPHPEEGAWQSRVAEHLPPPSFAGWAPHVPSAAPDRVSPCWPLRPAAGLPGLPWSRWNWWGWPELAAPVGSEGWPAWCEGWAGTWGYTHTLCLRF